MQREWGQGLEKGTRDKGQGTRDEGQSDKTIFNWHICTTITTITTIATITTHN